MDGDHRLLRAAIAFARDNDVPALLRTACEAMRVVDDLQFGGLGIYDARRQVLIVHVGESLEQSTVSGDSVALSADGEEFPVRETEFAAILAQPATYRSPDLQRERPLSLQQRLHHASVRWYVSVPLASGDQLLGTFYACFRGTDAPSDKTVAYLEELASLLAPALWNHLIKARLSKGDRRRETLNELSQAINTSLRLEPVLRSASGAIQKLEGHQLSVIGLLDEDGQTYRAFRHDQFADDALGSVAEPERSPVRSTTLAWIIEHEQTYESGDLERDMKFEGDKAFLSAGARRYVAAPMFVRGKIIGAFFFGTPDPHPSLTTDVWLCENIALQLALAIDNAIQFEELQRLTEQLKQQNIYLREEIDTEHNVEGIIGRSPKMQHVFDQINRVAGTDSSVLILGETGVGKELVARAIHARSGRANHPLVKVNCAAIPEALFESELFGHERGAFTSASARRLGRFELAKDGTLFLDEIGELPLGVQVKLLRVLQDGEFDRVGGTTTLNTNARIIAATNRDLLKAVADRTFRSDLYYRLDVFPILVPPLNERREDIPLLVDAFITQLNRRMGRQIESIDPESLEYLSRREWHGNVRELQHVIERAMVLCDGPCLSIDMGGDRQKSLAGEPPPHSPAPLAEPSVVSSDVAASVPDAPAASPGTGTLDEIMRSHILRVLQQTGGIVDGPRGAATLLGLKPSTLRSRMDRLGIKRPNPRHHC